jgi:hypothetical protein
MFLQSDGWLCTVRLKFVSRDERQMSTRVEQTGAPQARSEGSAAGAEEGSQGQVRSVASTPPLDQSPKSARAPKGRQPRASWCSVGPSGLNSNY